MNLKNQGGGGGKTGGVNEKGGGGGESWSVTRDDNDYPIDCSTPRRIEYSYDNVV